MQRGKGRPSKLTNAAAIELTIKALGLDDQYAALTVACRGIAAAVDLEPENASLWREYRQLLAELERAGAGGADDDATSFLARIQVRSKVRD